MATRDTDDQHIKIKVTVHQKDTTTVNIFAYSTGTSK